MGGLVSYLKGHSLYCEKLLFHRFVSDVMTGATEDGYQIEVLSPEIDQSGHDIVLRQGPDTLQYLQLKGVALGAKTRAWPIHVSHILPALGAWEVDWTFGPDQDHATCGLGGGVVLQVYYESGDGRIDVLYGYTDLLIAWFLDDAWARRLLKRQIKDLRGTLGNIDIPRQAFLPAVPVAGILASMGFHVADNALSQRAHSWRGTLQSSRPNDKEAHGRASTELARLRSKLLDVHKRSVSPRRPFWHR